jgi:hypothetical protein
VVPMILPVVLRRSARAEYDAAGDWYERQRPGLGAAFTTAVQKVFDRIAAQPQLFQVVLRDIRRVVVPGFPYCVYYRERPSGNRGDSRVPYLARPSRRAPDASRIVKSCKGDLKATIAGLADYDEATAAQVAGILRGSAGDGFEEQARAAAADAPLATRSGFETYFNDWNLSKAAGEQSK